MSGLQATDVEDSSKVTRRRTTLLSPFDFSAAAEPPVVVSDTLLERIKNNNEELLEFVEACSKMLLENEKGMWVDYGEQKRVARLQGKAEYMLAHVVEQNFAYDAVGHSYSNLSVDFQVKETSLAHRYDLMALQERVYALFDWYESEEIRAQYLAPYFPLIQSSGMGKTKLLYELKQWCNMGEGSDRKYHAILVLCSSGELEGDMTQTYNEAVELEECMKREPDPEMKYREVERELEHTCRSHNGKPVILLFDEAQNLLVGKDNYLFNCIQWWLAKKNKKPSKVVAVFAGTTLQFASIQREPPESKQWGEYWMDGSSRYPPFFHLHTMGCLLARGQRNLKAANNEFEESIYYGRPLFAKMGEKKLLGEESQVDILRRLVLSHADNWAQRVDSCFSVLATRVQMGQTSFNIASELVSRGYAVLSDLDMDQRVAEICHLPDPVPARLAMCLMKDDWTTLAFGLQGQPRSFWVQQMTNIFSHQTCIPSAGDVGEVYAALYMLFCGDILRFQLPDNPDCKTFSVPLCQWVHLISHGGVEPETGWDDFGQSVDCSICFIQVTQNYLRYDPEGGFSHWTHQHFLRHLYQSRTAFYVFEDCSVFDIFASIRYNRGDNEPPEYHPLLISIQCLPKFSPSEATSGCCAMEMMLTKARCYSGLCILLIIGRVSKAEFDEDLMLTQDDLANVPTEVVSKVVEIPNDDAFDITRQFWSITSAATEEAEVFASHSFLGWTQQEDVETLHCLRKGKRQEEETRNGEDGPYHYLEELRQNVEYVPHAEED